MRAAGKLLSNESLISNTWASGCLVIFLSNYSAIILFRYIIDRHTDLDRYFNIQDDGVIKTTKPLDREETAWHNISVIATEACTYSLDGVNLLAKTLIESNGKCSDVSCILSLGRNHSEEMNASNWSAEWSDLIWLCCLWISHIWVMHSIMDYLCNDWCHTN